MLGETTSLLIGSCVGKCKDLVLAVFKVIKSSGSFAINCSKIIGAGDDCRIGIFAGAIGFQKVQYLLDRVHYFTIAALGKSQHLLLQIGSVIIP